MKVRRMGPCAALAAATMIAAGDAALGGEATYYPYPMYEEYWKDASPDQEPVNRTHPGNGRGRPEGNGAPAAKETPRWQSVPGFLFPKELGFGVAVGVPEDLFYLQDSYYLAREGRWYRSSSYRGPWKPVPRAKLPPVLLKHDLAEIRKFRNREFRAYWEKGEKYRGRHFRPGKSGGAKRPD